jgi:ketopantoate reductase
MRILVIGTGIIGSIYGWALAESGQDVVLFLHDEYTKRCSGHAFGDPIEAKAFMTM